MRTRLLITGIVFATVVLLLLNIALGSVYIPLRAVIEILAGNISDVESWAIIINKTRLPQSLTAVLGGAGLAVSGLQMQTLFRNPLADPSIMGVSSGAGLGVALVLMAGNIGELALSTHGIFGHLTITTAALGGAVAVLFMILFLSNRLRNNAMLLIAGIMTGYVASSLISILKFYSMKEDVHSFVIWGLGSFSSVSWLKMQVFAPAVLTGLLFSFLLIKPLNILALGEDYARNLGVNIKKSRFFILFVTGLLTAVITAFCGPIAFLGLAVPHITRSLFRTSNQRILVPAVMLSGAALALFCNLIARLPGFDGALPVNAVTGIIGAPIVIWVIVKGNRIY
ncbi:MAG: iron ABC transporter permease [Cytophagaceae bacterium]|nr:iron ABC transporter permease [Cytophagaceae bacterium]